MMWNWYRLLMSLGLCICILVFISRIKDEDHLLIALVAVGLFMFKELGDAK